MPVLVKKNRIFYPLFKKKQVANLMKNGVAAEYYKLRKAESFANKAR